MPLMRQMLAVLTVALLLWSVPVRSVQAAGAETPQDLIYTIADAVADGQADQIVQLIDQSTADGKKVAVIVRDALDAIKLAEQLEQALIDKFDVAGLEDVMPGEGTMTFGAGTAIDAQEIAALIESAQIDQKGDMATVSFGDDEDPLPLIRKDGRWYIDTAQIVKEAGPLLDPIAKIIKAFAALIKQGQDLVETSDTLDDFKAKLEPKAQALMGQLMMVMFQAMGEAEGLQMKVEGQAAAGAVTGASIGAAAGAVIAAPAKAAQPQADAAQHWADFNHYVLIARPDLAAAAGQALLVAVDEEQLLAIVEAGDYKNWAKTMALADKIDTVREVSAQIAARIQAGRVAQSRDRARIEADIERLAGTERAREGALERLAGAGQFAAPQLLAALVDQKRVRLHPHIMTAMVALGRPLVYPLSIALPRLEPVPMGQVAQVLAAIGYPRALPYLKQVVEDPSTDAEALVKVQTAADRLSATVGLTDDLSAAELLLAIGDNFYQAGTHGDRLSGYDSARDVGIVWTYNRDAGLVPITVPTPIYADVMAMRASQRALWLDAQLDPALSLWLGANLRRENRLPPGEVDRSYDADLDPAFYARMAGPMRLHDVLHRALDDNDTDLALDAIDALLVTAGTEALINRQGVNQPLLRALSYPDRRVRYAAAFVMTHTRPMYDFPASYLVVSVLSEAVRQSELRHALVLASDQEALNGLIADISELEYEVTGGTSLAAVTDAINAGPGFDVIIARGSAAQIESYYHDAAENYKLAAAPIVALVTAADQIDMDLTYKDDSRLRTTVDSVDAQALRTAVEQAMADAVGEPITADQAADYASTALAMLRVIAVEHSPIYEPADAEPAVIRAIDDQRQQIVMQAGQVLALIGSQQSQLTVADAALDVRRDESVRISLLDSLAESAMQFGNKLGQIQIDNLLELIKNSDGGLALAAARAHGALTLQTVNVVDLLTR